MHTSSVATSVVVSMFVSKLSKVAMVVSPEHTAAWVRELRQRLELSQEKFAVRLGVAYLTVNRWENGHTQPSPMARKLLESMTHDLGDRGADLVKRYFADDRSPSSTP